MWDKDWEGQVVSTDYDSYIISYLCEEVGLDQMSELLYISVRDPNLSQDKLDEIIKIAEEGVKGKD